MKHIPSYGKILTLGALYTENALIGDVSIQEKVDGSQFRFGWNEDGEIICSSKAVSIDLENPPQLFREGVEYIKDKLAQIQATNKIPYRDIYFYAEYLQKPKHNTLAYDRIPKNHIVLFDVFDEGNWLTQAEVSVWSGILEVDLIPTLHRGFASIETITDLLQTQSYLGGQILEGVVIKNYGQTIEYAGKLQVLFTKFVREEFKELHRKNEDYMPRTNKLDALMQSYRSESRWLKAIQHLRDRGELEQSPRDIGKLIQEVPIDIIEECGEEFKDRLFKLMMKEFTGAVTRGLPEFYKEYLLKNLNTSDETL